MKSLAAVTDRALEWGLSQDNSQGAAELSRAAAAVREQVLTQEASVLWNQAAALRAAAGNKAQAQEPYREPEPAPPRHLMIEVQIANQMTGDWEHHSVKLVKLERYKNDPGVEHLIRYMVANQLILPTLYLNPEEINEQMTKHPEEEGARVNLRVRLGEERTDVPPRRLKNLRLSEIAQDADVLKIRFTVATTDIERDEATQWIKARLDLPGSPSRSPKRKAVQGSQVRCCHAPADGDAGGTPAPALRPEPIPSPEHDAGGNTSRDDGGVEEETANTDEPEGSNEVDSDRKTTQVAHKCNKVLVAEVIESLFREMTTQPEGQVCLTKGEIVAAIHTRKRQAEIGEGRASKIRAWVAAGVEVGAVSMREPRRTSPQGAIEAMLRERSGQAEGIVYLSQEHMRAAIHSRKCEKEIGANRAVQIRAWVATAVGSGEALMLDPEGIEWMGERERHLCQEELRLLRTMDTDERKRGGAEHQRELAKAAVLSWAAENEEPEKGGWIALRKEKRAQLRTLRAKVWNNLGKGALNATLLVLLLSAQAFPEVDPGENWINEAAAWVVLKQWDERTAAVIEELAAKKLEEARAQYKKRDGDRGWRLVFDLGEGWGSIGTAAAAIGIATIGVDRAGIVYQGTLHGHVRARVHMDFAVQHEKNLLQRIAKKAGVSMGTLLAVWLSPECTLLSRANGMNTSRGCAHGPYAEHPDNLAAATPERIELEREKYHGCIRAVEEQMRALEEEGDTLFALENPVGSYFWELEAVKSRITRLAHRGWKVIRVDQCAYGRCARKETLILTNIQWDPRGVTGTGRCMVGRCTGTLGAIPGTPGADRHTQQTITSEHTRRTRVGEMPKGSKGDYSVEAAKNMVMPMLVQEILAAAVRERAVGANGK